MKYLFLVCIVLLSFVSCDEAADSSMIIENNWESRTATISPTDSLEFGSTYLSIYSQIYSKSQSKTHNLTAMASIRNISESDTVYLSRAEYFDSKGRSIKNYISKPVYLAPLETLDIVIIEPDTLGGTGANFIFDWYKDKQSLEPYFEAVMSSTLGQQGLSITTQGKRIK